jgi:hypothetical protein
MKNIEIYTIGTAAQKESYRKLKAKWHTIDKPQIKFGDTWFVKVGSENHETLFLGIEPDGSIHS